MYGPNGTINSGSPYLGGTGDCTENVTPFFNWPESSTATDYQDQLRGYAYGGKS